MKALTRPSEVQALLAGLDFRPSRVLGQNFLIDFNILQRLLDLAQLDPADQVLEVGPGLGVLTAGLLERAARVVAIEKDDVLFAHLQRAFAGEPRLELRHADALETDLAALLAGGLTKLVANLPYGIASRLLVELAEAPQPPVRLVVTVQREVAERIAAPPDVSAYGLLSILLQARYTARIEKRVSPSCFLPAPEVTSAIVSLVRPAAPAPLAQPRHFKALVRMAFSQRRKQLGGLLRHAPELAGPDYLAALADLGVAPTTRPETLAPAQWIALSNRLAAALPGGRAAGKGVE